MTDRAGVRRGEDGHVLLASSALPPPSADGWRSRAGAAAADALRPVADFPELDCMRRRAPPAVIAAAERRAREVGVTADHVLLASGMVAEANYVSALAHNLGLAFEPLDRFSRAACPLGDDRLIESGAVGLLPLIEDDDFLIVVAPRGVAARRLAALAAASPGLRRRIRLTTGECLRRFVHRHASAALGRRAAFGLYAARPDLSAAPRAGRASRLKVLAVAAFALAFATAAPNLAATLVGVTLSALFLAWSALRLIGALAAPEMHVPGPRRPDRELPVYTIIVALYREAAAARRLVAALDALDWPREKLDVKFALEADDRETLAALEAMSLGRPYEIIVAPPVGPRTKPKALNVALPFARGEFVAVYDAEDRPEPDQLRRAFEAFASADDRLACVQARLTIDNTADGWLTRMFTAEYAGLFDVLLPGLAAFRLPLPLGGSSNHFRAATLRAVGGWDPHNLTEDADLGMRLARFGCRSDVIDSTTYEEAPAALPAWLRQRRRWFQGWMQTWLVHMRAPVRLWRELGPAGFAAFQLVVGGTALAALAHPLFLVAMAVEGLCAPAAAAESGAVETLLGALFGATFAGGYLATGILGMMGLARRRLASTAWVLLLAPVHWLLLSVAAWQAAAKLVRDPYRWDKTEHGLARTSRSGERLGAGSGANGGACAGADGGDGGVATTVHGAAFGGVVLNVSRGSSISAANASRSRARSETRM